MFGIFGKLFTKTKEVKEINTLREYVSDKTNSPTHDMFKNIDWSKVPDPEIDNPDAKESILLLDDINFTDMLYEEDFNKIKKNNNLDITKEYKLVKCLGEQAGFMAYKYSVINKNSVDFGILDITLGNRIKINDEWMMELDGIDIAKYLSEVNPNFKYVLCTAHTLNKSASTIKTYNEKCKKIFGYEMDQVYLNKNIDRYETIYKLLKG